MARPKLDAVRVTHTDDYWVSSLLNKGRLALTSLYWRLISGIEMPVWWRAEALKKVTQGCMLDPWWTCLLKPIWSHLPQLPLCLPCDGPTLTCGGVGKKKKKKRDKSVKTPHPSYLLRRRQHQARGITWNHWSHNKEQTQTEQINDARESYVSVAWLWEHWFLSQQECLAPDESAHLRIWNFLLSFIVLAKPNEDFGETPRHTERLSAEVTYAIPVGNGWEKRIRLRVLGQVQGAVATGFPPPVPPIALCWGLS